MNAVASVPGSYQYTPTFDALLPAGAQTLTVLFVPTGASLTGLTVIDELAVALENAVVPPLTVVFAVAPAAPLLWSQARKVMPAATDPFQLALGTKRT
jgi:uncharacterized metal-binding protein